MKRVSVLSSKEGYAMLGDFVDRNLVTDRESKAALEDSSIDGKQSIDLDSEGSDDEIKTDIMIVPQCVCAMSS